MSHHFSAVYLLLATIYPASLSGQSDPFSRKFSSDELAVEMNPGGAGAYTSRIVLVIHPLTSKVISRAKAQQTRSTLATC
ncbi:MAG TPA: hypothetical protein VMZ52_02095 [Bryobacteraceae bacterium]|nr:hypothetical protein [Bryobacteraceae bacterium]